MQILLYRYRHNLTICFSKYIVCEANVIYETAAHTLNKICYLKRKFIYQNALTIKKCIDGRYGDLLLDKCVRLEN